MFKKLMITAAFSAAALAAAHANAGTYNFDFDDGAIEGTFYTSDTLTNGGYNIEGISGVALGEQITSLLTNPNIGQTSLSPNGAFDYDDLLMPTSNPVLSYEGVVFNTTSGQYNLYSNGADNYNFINAAGTSLATGTTVSVSAAPEPGTWALMFGGLAMIGGMLRVANARRRENEVAGIATA